MGLLFKFLIMFNILFLIVVRLCIFNKISCFQFQIIFHMKQQNKKAV